MKLEGSNNSKIKHASINTIRVKNLLQNKKKCSLSKNKLKLQSRKGNIKKALYKRTSIIITK